MITMCQFLMTVFTILTNRANVIYVHILYYNNCFLTKWAINSIAFFAMTYTGDLVKSEQQEVPQNVTVSTVSFIFLFLFIFA